MHGTHRLGGFFAYLCCLPSLLSGEEAQPREYPTPAALIEAEVWKNPAFLDVWVSPSPSSDLQQRFWPPGSEVFGLAPQAIHGTFEGERLTSVTLLFLDAGTHFGYRPGQDKVATTPADAIAAFHESYRLVAAQVKRGLEVLSGAPPEMIEIGSQHLLRQQTLLFACGNLWARLHQQENQLLKVTFFLDRESATSWLHPSRSVQTAQGRTRLLKAKQCLENGDVLLLGVPLYLQGDRAYCGVSALTMVSQHLGLAIDTEDLAASAGIRYGATAGSRIRQVYSACFDELEIPFRRNARFDFEEARQSIDAGYPVVVWRRWRDDRDYLHTQFTSRWKKDASLTLPLPDETDRRLWPGEDDHNHASVITGYNLERREVIFSESWSEAVRNRRMRIEEMTGTSYQAFYPGP